MSWGGGDSDDMVACQVSVFVMKSMAIVNDTLEKCLQKSNISKEMLEQLAAGKKKGIFDKTSG